MQDDFIIYDYFPLIRVSDKAYPFTMPMVRASLNQVSFPIPVRAFVLEPFGYMPIYPTPMPPGDVVTRATPELGEDGKYYEVWHVRDYTEEEEALQLQYARDALFEGAKTVILNDLESGISVTANGKNYFVDVSSVKLSLLMSIRTLAKDAAPDETFEYRFMDDQIIILTRDEFLNLWQETSKRVYEVHRKFWHFSEGLKLITSRKDLPEQPLTFK